MSRQSSSWEDVSESNSDASSRESLCIRTETWYSQHCHPRFGTNMSPNIRQPIVDSDASSDASSRMGFRPPGMGGAPLYSPSPSPEKLEKRSVSALTSKAPGGNMDAPPSFKDQSPGMCNLRAYDGYKSLSHGSGINAKAEPMTPVRGTSRTASQGYALASTAAPCLQGNIFHPAAGSQIIPAKGGSTVLAPVALDAIASMAPMREEKEHHPAYLSIRSQCVMGQERITGLRKALVGRHDVSAEVCKLLDIDMEQFNNMLSTIVQQAILLANTLDENSEQHQTLKKMLATQTLEGERQNAIINSLWGTIEGLRNEMAEMKQNHSGSIMKLQEQVKPSPFGGPSFIADKGYFEKMPTIPTNDGGGNNVRTHRGNFGFHVASGTLMSPDYAHQTPGLMGFPPQQPQRAASFAGAPRYGPHSSARKFSGYKSSGAARFNIDEHTPTRPSGGGYRDQNSSASQALVSRVPVEEDRVVSEWAERFSKLWASVGAYCRTYVTGENKTLHLFLQTNAPNVWQYICDVLYPNNPTTAGSSHAQALLADVESRVHLAQRLVVQYFINQMWCAEGWSQFNGEVDESFRQAENRLKTLDVFHIAERQAAFEAQAQVITRILMDGRFQEFRQFKINHHVDRVKMIVGPMISTNKMRNESQFDLHSLVSHAMEVSAVMFESRRRFDFIWNDTCGKFSAEHHNSLDNPIPPLALQARQWRLKLVVTPGTAVYDERHPSVSRRVLKSDVLVMN